VVEIEELSCYEERMRYAILCADINILVEILSLLEK
jgi:hypothetical protein